MTSLHVIKKVKPGIDGCILIDVDHPSPKHCNTVTLCKLLGIMGLTPEWMRFDRTRRGWHIIIKVEDEHLSVDIKVVEQWQIWLYRATILLLQSILGDDPKRAAYNFHRLRQGIWLNQLFEPTERK